MATVSGFVSEYKPITSEPPAQPSGFVGELAWLILIGGIIWIFGPTLKGMVESWGRRR